MGKKGESFLFYFIFGVARCTTCCICPLTVICSIDVSLENDDVERHFIFAPG